MKRLGSSDSLGALMSIFPSTDEKCPPPRSNHVYSRDFQSMLDGLDEEGCLEEPGHFTEKKRRLSVDQVKALEKSFEVENKLEPERKVKLAQELGLQSKQVAVWFQNRRARWKTKQLERDYGVLKANFDALKHNFDALQRDNEALLKQIGLLKSKLDEESTESNVSVSVKEEEALVSESDQYIKGVPNAVAASPFTSLPGSEANYKSSNTNNNNAGISSFTEFKEGVSSDSDSSGILNEGGSPDAAAAANSLSRVLQNQHLLITSSPVSSTFRFNTCSYSSSHASAINCLKFPDAGEAAAALAGAQKVYQLAQYVKMEEHSLFGGDEACNFFSDEQAPSLHWYCPDQWT